MGYRFMVARDGDAVVVHMADWHQLRHREGGCDAVSRLSAQEASNLAGALLLHACSVEGIDPADRLAELDGQFARSRGAAIGPGPARDAGASPLPDES